MSESVLKSILTKHMKQCLPLEQRKKFKCDTCGAEYLSKQTLDNRMQQKHQNKRYVCETLTVAKFAKQGMGLRSI